MSDFTPTPKYVLPLLTAVRYGTEWADNGTSRESVLRWMDMNSYSPGSEPMRLLLSTYDERVRLKPRAAMSLEMAHRSGVAFGVQGARREDVLDWLREQGYGDRTTTARRVLSSYSAQLQRY